MTFQLKISEILTRFDHNDITNDTNDTIKIPV